MAYVTDQIVDMLISMEGLELKPYADVGGLPTIGYGHLITKDEDFSGKTLSKSEALDLLKQDIAAHQDPWMKKLSTNVSDETVAALTSLAFNSGAYGPVQKAVELINAGKPNEAADFIQIYNKATIDGRLTQVKGLTDRRALEGKMIRGEVKGDLAQAWNNRKSILGRGNPLATMVSTGRELLSLDRLYPRKRPRREATYRALPKNKANSDETVLAQLRELNKKLGVEVQETNWNVRVLREGKGWRA